MAAKKELITPLRRIILLSQWTESLAQKECSTTYQWSAGEVIHVQRVNFQFQINAVCMLGAAQEMRAEMTFCSLRSLHKTTALHPKT